MAKARAGERRHASDRGSIASWSARRSARPRVGTALLRGGTTRPTGSRCLRARRSRPSWPYCGRRSDDSRPTTERSSRSTCTRAIRSTRPPESCRCRSTPFDPDCARPASGCAANSRRPTHDPDPGSDERRAPGPAGAPAADRAGRRCGGGRDAGGDDDGGGRIPCSTRRDRRSPTAAPRRGRIADPGWRPALWPSGPG